MHLTTVKLYGSLGRQFGREHRYAISTAAESIKALKSQHKGFIEAFINTKFVKIISDNEELITGEQFHVKHRINCVKIVPTHAGAGIETSIAYGLVVAGVSASTAIVVAGAITSVLSSLLTALVLAGISKLLYSAPDSQSAGSSEKPDNQPSYHFNGAVNTIREGNPVPLLYGRMRVGSQIISAGLVAEEYNG